MGSRETRRELAALGARPPREAGVPSRTPRAAAGDAGTPGRRAVSAELVPATRAASGFPATWPPRPAHARERMQTLKETRAASGGRREGTRSGPDREGVASTSPGLPARLPLCLCGRSPRRPPATTLAGHRPRTSGSVAASRDAAGGGVLGATLATASRWARSVGARPLLAGAGSAVTRSLRSRDCYSEPWSCPPYWTGRGSQ